MSIDMHIIFNANNVRVKGALINIPITYNSVNINATFIFAPKDYKSFLS